jgi:Leucine-rich repeat (LRR) protein
MIANYTPNSDLAKSIRTKAHDSYISELNKAKRSTILHLSHYNISEVLPEIYSLTALTFLDLAYNNLTTISPNIANLKALNFLWLNNNPLKAIPVDISQCRQLKEIDVRETQITGLPREMADLKGLVSLKLDGCPLKSDFMATLKGTTTIGEHMLSVSMTLKRKYDRRDYKAKLCNKLIEWKYPSTNKEKIEEKVEQLFESLKDINSAGLKRLVRQFLRLFPKNFEDINILEIKNNLNQLESDETDREKISQFILMLRANFPKELLDNVVRLAKDVYKNSSEATLKEMLKYRKYVFIGKFEELSYATLAENMEKYKKGKLEQKAKAVKGLRKKLLKLYKDDKIEESLIDSMLGQIVNYLKKVDVIEDFSQKAKKYLPKAVEINSFNAQSVTSLYLKERQAAA